MEPDIRYCTTSDGVSIAYYVMGEGETLLIASNVLWSNLRYSPVYLPEYHRMGHGLGRGMRVVRYDSRGAGMSDRSVLDFSLEARLGDLEAVIAKAAPPTFTLVASHHGALSAVHYAARHPDRVTRLILLAPIVDGKRMRDRNRRFDSLREMAAAEWEEYTLAMAAVNFGYDDPALVRMMAGRFREAMSPVAVQAYTESLENIDVSPDLGDLTMPVLVLFREQTSRSQSVEDMRAIADRIPKCEFLHIKGPPGTFWGREEAEAIERFVGIAPPDLPDATPAPSERRKTSGLQTILFTDIEANTALLQRVGDDAWRAILRECEQTTRRTLMEHEGTEVKTMGDAFMASFNSASAAIACAVTLQREFPSDADGPHHGLRLRIGINAGEPIAEDDDLFGTAVTMTARIQSLAKGGEILVSDVVRQLVAGKGFLFHDRGETALRGFEDPVGLYEVRTAE